MQSKKSHLIVGRFVLKKHTKFAIKYSVLFHNYTLGGGTFLATPYGYNLQNFIPENNLL